MAILSSITLHLSNETALPKVWNVGGGAMQEAVYTSRQTYIGLAGEGAGKYNYIGLAQAGEVPMSFVGQPGEGAPSQMDLQTIEDIKEFNASMFASPFRLNRLKLYTNNVEQVIEKFAYYKQTASGAYEKKLLDFLPHYTVEHPRAVIDLDEQELGGEIILDVTRKFEITVLPFTILTIDLIFESQDLTENMAGFHFDEPAHKFLDPDEEEKKKDEDKEPEPQVDLEEVELFVKTYYKHAFAYEQTGGVPVLFSLAEAALLTSYTTERPGESLYDKVVDRKWQGESVAVEREIAGPKAAIGEKIIKQVDKDTFLVQKHLRAYSSLTYSIADFYSRLHKGERFKPVFNFSSRPYSFAGALAEANYSHSEQFLDNIEHVMEIIEPFVLAQQRSVFGQKQALAHRKLIFLAAGAVLFFVLIWLLLKPSLATKLL